MSADDDLLKKRQSVLDVGQRNQFEAVQTEVRRNNEALTSLRRENKELRAALQQTLRGQRNVTIEDHYAKEEDMLHNKMCVLKRSLNAVKGKNTELAKEIEKTKEENANVQEEGAASTVNENSAVAKKIRALENRLDKCLIKHNEVNAIRRTYETLLERLQLEQAGFDTQLSSTEKALQSAERELNELNEVGQQANKSRDQARAEVSRLKAKLAEDRRVQTHDLDQRRDFIQEKRNVLEKKHNALLAKMAQQEERHAKAMQSVMGTGGGANGRRRLQDTERSTTGTGATRNAASWLAALTTEELEELQRQKEAYLTLREATMSSTVGEVVDKVMERRDNYEQLQKTASELDGAVALSQATRQRLQDAWEEMNQRAGGAMVSAKATRAARDTRRLRLQGSASGDGADDDDDDDDDASGMGTMDGPDYGLLASRVRQNRTILAEFSGHLKDRERELEEAQQQQDTLSQLVTDVEAGVLHLAEKLSVLHGSEAAHSTPSLSATNTASAFPAPGNNISGTMGTLANDATSFAALLRTRELGEAALMACGESADLLRSCDAKMQMMLDELSLEEVDAVARAMGTARVIIPATNVRLALVSSHDANQAGDGAWTEGGEGRVSTAAGLHSRADGGSSSGSNEGRSSAGEDPYTALTAATGAGALMDDFPDSEIHDRKELKMMSMATVEREETKRMRKRVAAAAHRAEDAM